MERELTKEEQEIEKMFEKAEKRGVFRKAMEIHKALHENYRKSSG